MKAARFFNPLHVLANGEVTEEDVDGLALFRFAKHPKLAPKLLEMKSEIAAYNSLIKAALLEKGVFAIPTIDG